MGYRIRVLTTGTSLPPLSELRKQAEPAVLEQDPESGGTWDALILRHSSGTKIALIERNPVVEGELGAEELREYLDEIPDYGPPSAAAWLMAYLPGVKTIYAFQFLSGTESEDGFDALQRVYEALWRHVGGILQADGEGFSNEQGFTILWQFGDNVEGDWQCGVLNGDGSWTNFEMDLGDAEQRKDFLAGRVPSEVKLLTTWGPA